MEIDALPVPSATVLTVVDALEKVEILIPKMHESAALCSRLLGRLRFLRDALMLNSSQLAAVALSTVATQFASTLDLVVRLLEKFSEKKPLERIAASRLIRNQVRALHGKIDTVFTAAGLPSAPEMVEWKQHEAADVSTQRTLLQELVGNSANLADGLTQSSLIEALTELKSEIECRQNSDNVTELMARVLRAVIEKTRTVVPILPSWYIRRDDVVLGEPFDMGPLGELYKGTWNGKEVCIKVLYMDGADAEREFMNEAMVWHSLTHPNIVKFHGGCHVGDPLFFVSELAREENFAEYFRQRENDNNMWRLFHQAAKGLAYLHSRRAVHGDLKCNNLLVGEDGIAKICDFGFSFFNDVTVVDIKEQLSSHIWKAPECIFETGPAANPTFKSDVYALGMCIIEAKIGEVPWGIVSDDDIADQLEDGYPRPDGAFTDREWRLVQAMTTYDPEERMSTEEALETLAEFAREEEVVEKESDAKLRTAIEKEFESIGFDERVIEELDRVVDFINNLPADDQELRDELVQHVRQVQFWSKKEVVDRKNWESNVPTSSRCDACGTLNALDSSFCCDCGSLIDGYRSPEATVFRFFVSNQSELNGAIQALEKLAGTAERSGPQSVVCPECEVPNLIGRRFCTDCISRLDTATLRQADDPVRIALLHHIARLKVVQQHSRDEKARLQLLKKEEPQVLVCSNCGDVNPREEIFCRECGNDIEIICGVKL